MLPGIYRYSQGTLTVCFGKQINLFKVDRPTSFTTQRKDGRLLIVFKKATAKDVEAAKVAANKPSEKPKPLKNITSIIWEVKSPTQEARLKLSSKQYNLKSTRIVGDKAVGSRRIKQNSFGEWEVAVEALGIVALQRRSSGRPDQFGSSN